MISLRGLYAKRLISLLVILIAFLTSYVLGQPGIMPPQVKKAVTPGYYAVLSTEDGDTITVNMNGKKERIRLIGVDTPETQDPRKPVQCFGHMASAFTRQLIGSNLVRLESDPLSSNRDRYKRLLRYVYLPDGRLVQAEIIKQGYGFAYTSFPFTKSEEFAAYQRRARQANLGLWASCQLQTNKYGGHESNPEQ